MIFFMLNIWQGIKIVLMLNYFSIGLKLTITHDVGTICNAVSAVVHHAGAERRNVTVVVVICYNQYSATLSHAQPFMTDESHGT